uniref:Uncharacterized protein n=1 Tax=Acrobeloides nanus TaxID=290746 RepID=A0A914E579_9BILA
MQFVPVPDFILIVAHSGWIMVHETGFRIRILNPDSESGFRIRILIWMLNPNSIRFLNPDSASGFRIRIQNPNPDAESGF